ncbi:hypothetical protein Tco_1149569 [Tanacetum coccineum]
MTYSSSSLSEQDTSSSLDTFLVLCAIIMEYLVKISKKDKHSGALTKTFEDYCSDNQYAVSIKEDTAYLCLHFTKDHEGNKTNTTYPMTTNTPYSSYGNKYSGRYRT